MKDIALKDLLEAGCHFGHKSQKWHPKASKFIYQKKEGIHIIDLVKTRDGMRKAGERVKTLALEGKVLLVVATKRQAKGIVTEMVKNAGIPYMTNRWVGGFITNWEEVKKNIDKVNMMKKEKEEGGWQKFPKHEQVKLDKDLRKLELVYGGVAQLTSIPDAVFIIDIKKEDICLKEVRQKDIVSVAIVDTNSNPDLVHYVIPANDDAVGSIQFIAKYIIDAYVEGRNILKKQEKGKDEIKNPTILSTGKNEEIKTDKIASEQNVKDENRKKEEEVKSDSSKAKGKGVKKEVNKKKAVEKTKTNTKKKTSK
ncbi:30S ribosomal protein S2 [Candidatus Gottesmanbacteria bacterium CG_4_10_14_0_8_um_filter_37_24]|uniref:Small ribosomal subunit protein uS2 n=1 Tax=Candidatus Gottesmanbacteria bacterium CG_4_10_14_0_8_um_filter_37_24 TaxID=1974574 RepID=A0A2M7RQ32_9BACT|nr:MAG: 30S ribosomal protein S2 [Candidatus Gottesmanbacteria bacterium CG23_combo_of_CG06-09_8_20_14_all_37_19]PIZ02280.1 MAG: 30S ribosomal protein S2 [Candidatus Gottesmanbacteria bacterium CG_4_10_14_0_8_um_filter_37_24]